MWNLGRPVRQLASTNGDVEAIRVLRVAYRSAVKARTQAANQLHALLVTAPLELLEQPAACRCGSSWSAARGCVPDSPTAITKYTLRRLARRFQQLDEEASELKAHMRRLIRHLAPTLLAEQGISTITAAALLVAAGDNPERLRSESSFAHLCGEGGQPLHQGRWLR